MKSFWQEQRAQSEFGSLYMLLIFVIAALALVAVIKPMFRASQKVASQTIQK